MANERERLTAEQRLQIMSVAFIGWISTTKSVTPEEAKQLVGALCAQTERMIADAGPQADWAKQELVTVEQSWFKALPAAGIRYDVQLRLVMGAWVQFLMEALSITEGEAQGQVINLIRRTQTQIEERREAQRRAAVN